MNKKLKSALALLIHPNLILISIILVGLTWFFGGDIVKTAKFILAVVVPFVIVSGGIFLFTVFEDWYDRTFNDNDKNRY